MVDHVALVDLLYAFNELIVSSWTTFYPNIESDMYASSLIHLNKLGFLLEDLQNFPV